MIIECHVNVVPSGKFKLLAAEAQALAAERHPTGKDLDEIIKSNEEGVKRETVEHPSPSG